MRLGKLPRAENSRSFGVQKNRFDPNLIPLPVLQLPGTKLSLSFSKSGMGTGRSLLIEIEELRKRTWGPVASDANDVYIP
jgi:hypothetical protein